MNKHPALVALRFPLQQRPLTADEIVSTKAFYHAGDKKLGLLLLHGLSSTPAVWQQIVAKCVKVNYTIHAPVLAGHSNKAEDLLNIVWQDWLQGVEQAYIELSQQCENVIIIGHSLGGSLALQLAAKYSQIQKLFLVAPAVFPIFSLKFFIKLRITTLFQKLGLQFLPPLGGNIKKSGVWECAYSRIAIRALEEVYQCMLSTQRLLPQINTPITLFQAKHDLLIPRKETANILQKVNSTEKELIWYTDSYHVIPLDNNADELTEKILQDVGNHVEFTRKTVEKFNKAKTGVIQFEKNSDAHAK